MGRWSVERVLEQAPDAASVKAARGLARPGRWSETGATESLVWGRCQGSGKEPYQVSVDLSGPAFKCSCPSRKFPCKHGLALLLLWVEGDGSVADVSDPAAHAAAWDHDRRRRAAEGRVADRAAARARESTPEVDPEVAAARLAARLETMDAGLDDLERWMADLVRQGLGSARTLPYATWDAAAARLVDAKVPALAERVRELGGAVHHRTDWPDHLLAELARMQLALTAWRRRDQLDDATAADVRTALGWPRPTSEVRAGERVRDTWEVVGVRRAGDDRVRSQRTWLCGAETGRTVVLLDFAAGAATLEVPHALGAVLEGEVALYPGAPPQRALLADDHGVVAAGAGAGAHDSVDRAGGHATIEAALAEAAAALGADPLADRTLLRLAAAAVAPLGEGAVVVDPDRVALPVHPAVGLAGLLALTGGHPTPLVAEWEDGWAVPLSIVVDGRRLPVPIDDDRRAPRAGDLRATRWWSALVSVSLVGTDRRPRPEPPPGAPVPSVGDAVADAVAEAGPGAVAEPLPEADPGGRPGVEDGVASEAEVEPEIEPATRLLLDAAGEAARQRAGRSPVTVGGAPAPAPADDRPPAPADATRLLELVLGGAAGLTTGRDPVLAEWFDACADAGARLPHHLVARVLDLATSDERWRPAAAAVVGERGRWLATTLADWPWFAELDASAAAPSGESSGAAPGELTAGDPTAGDPTAGDPHAVARARLADGTPAQRARALQDLAGRSPEAQRRGGGPVGGLGAPRARPAAPDVVDLLEAALSDRATSVRSVAAGLLDHHPDSPRAARLEAVLAPLVSVTTSGVRRRPAVEVALPEDLDDAQRRDLPGTPRPREVGARAWQLLEIITGTPLDAWQRWTGLDPVALVAALPVRLELHEGLARAAVAQGRPDWAAALFPTRPGPELAAALAPDAVVDAVLTHLGDGAPNPQTVPALAQVLAARAEPSGATRLEAWCARRGDDPTTRAVRAAHHALTLRSAVRQAFERPGDAPPAADGRITPEPPPTPGSP